DRLNDELLLRLLELGVDRQGERSARRSLGFGEVTNPVSQIREALLKVERDGIVNFSADPTSSQMLSQRFAILAPHPDDELVIDVRLAGARITVGGRREPELGPSHDPTALEESDVAARVLHTPCDPR